MNLAIGGTDLQGSTKMFDRLIQLAALESRRGQMDMGPRVGRLGLYDATKVFSRPLQIPLLRQGEGEITMSGLIHRVDFQYPTEVLDRLPKIAFSGQGDTQAVMSGRIANALASCCASSAITPALKASSKNGIFSHQTLRATGPNHFPGPPSNRLKGYTSRTKRTSGRVIPLAFERRDRA